MKKHCVYFHSRRPWGLPTNYGGKRLLIVLFLETELGYPTAAFLIKIPRQLSEVEMDVTNVKGTLKFLSLMANLKHSPRRGWILRNVKGPESIAGHMYAMGIMTFLLGDNSNLDRTKCMQLALVHDLAECIVGDITPADNISPNVKHEMEEKAMKELISYLADDVGKIIYDLYKEYEAKETPEAKFVKELDVFDMIFTARLYENRNDSEPGSLDEFFDSVNKIHDPQIKALTAELLKERENDSRNLTLK